MLDAPVPIRGSRAFIKHVFRVAVTLGKYEVAIDRTTRRGTLSGEVVTSDPYLLTQSPLVFIVPALAAAGGRWPVESVAITGKHLVAQLGPLGKG